MRLAASLLALSSTALSACAAGTFGLRPTSYAMPGEAHVYATGYDCVHEPTQTPNQEFAPIIVAALTGIASQLLKNFGTALSEGAKGGPLPASASTINLELEPDAVPHCIVIIRGAFEPTAKALHPLDLPDLLGVSGKEVETTRLKSLNVAPVYAINHFIELRVDASANKKALTVAPVWVLMNQSIDGDQKGKRDVSIAVQFTRVGSSDKYGSTIVLQDRELGAPASQFVRIPATGRWQVESPWFATFHATSTKEGAVSGAIPSMNSRTATAIPVSLSTTVVETRPTKEGLAFIAGIYNGIEPKLEQRAKLLIDSDAAQAAHATADSAALTLKANFETAKAGARSAGITYCETSKKTDDAAGKLDRIEKSKALFEAQVKANDAALKADLQQPFPSLVSISEKLPDAANPNLCPWNAS